MSRTDAVMLPMLKSLFRTRIAPFELEPHNPVNELGSAVRSDQSPLVARKPEYRLVVHHLDWRTIGCSAIASSPALICSLALVCAIILISITSHSTRSSKLRMCVTDCCRIGHVRVATRSAVSSVSSLATATYSSSGIPQFGSIETCSTSTEAADSKRTNL